MHELSGGRRGSEWRSHARSRGVGPGGQERGKGAGAKAKKEEAVQEEEVSGVEASEVDDWSTAM